MTIEELFEKRNKGEISSEYLLGYLDGKNEGLILAQKIIRGEK